MEVCMQPYDVPLVSPLDASGGVTTSSSGAEVWLLFNPKAGAGRAAAQRAALAKSLDEAGWTVHATSSVADLPGAVRAWESGRLRALLTIGGDGTLRFVAQRVPAGLPLLPVPLGNENLVARWLGQRAAPSDVVETLTHGQMRWIDAGLVGSQLFLVMLSCGFDADVVRRVDTDRQGPISAIDYYLAICRSAQTYSFPELRLTMSGGQRRTARWILAFNLPAYAHRLPVAPDADPQDGQLDVVCLQHGGWWSPIRYVLGAWLGRHHRWSDVAMLHDEQVRIESDPPVPVQIDGDFVGHTPIDVGLLRRRVCLLAPCEPGQVVTVERRSTVGDALDSPSNESGSEQGGG
jgi:diacylglycerol kinase family enzyme